MHKTNLISIQSLNTNHDLFLEKMVSYQLISTIQLDCGNWYGSYVES